MPETLRNPKYRKRLLDRLVDELLEQFGAVRIEGPKYCGKTWCAQAHAASEVRLGSETVRTAVELDHRIALEGEAPRLIDEWQEIPALHDDVRQVVDDLGEPGRFLLTGSSLPPLGQYRHSGAGRIARVHMRTESLVEQGVSTSAVSVAGLFTGADDVVEAPHLGLGDIASLVCRGGWPAINGMPDRACDRLNRQYLEALFDDDAPRRGLSPSVARSLMASVARNVATAATLKTLGADMARGEGRTDESTVTKYLEFFKDLYVIEELPGWDIPVRSKKHMRVKPKRYFADPSLAASMLGVSASELLVDTQLLGLLFENLCLRDLQVYLTASGSCEDARISYYQDDGGLEVDFIVQLPDGRWGGIEVKLSDVKVPDAVASLTKLRGLVRKNEALDAREPSFLMALVGCGDHCYTTPEGVRVVPISLLGP